MQAVANRPMSVTLDQWKNQLEFQGILDPVDDKTSKNGIAQISANIKKQLIEAEWITIQGKRVWSVKSTVAEG